MMMACRVFLRGSLGIPQRGIISRCRIRPGVVLRYMQYVVSIGPCFGALLRFLPAEKEIQW